MLIDKLPFESRAKNCLRNEGIVYIKDLLVKSPAELLLCPNLGKKTFENICEVLDFVKCEGRKEFSKWLQNRRSERRRFEERYRRNREKEDEQFAKERVEAIKRERYASQIVHYAKNRKLSDEEFEYLNKGIWPHEIL